MIGVWSTCATGLVPYCPRRTPVYVGPPVLTAAGTVMYSCSMMMSKALPEGGKTAALWTVRVCDPEPDGRPFGGMLIVVRPLLENPTISVMSSPPTPRLLERPAPSL